MIKAEKDALEASVKGMKKAEVVKGIKKYDEMTQAPAAKLSDGYQEYKDFIFEESKAQANQKPIDIQEFNARRNDAKKKMSMDHVGGAEEQAQPIDKYIKPESDGNYGEGEYVK
jgi:hypothetical protein